MPDILISIKPEYVQYILNGTKTIELRRRNMKITEGTRLWIYSTLPKGCIEAVAIADTIDYKDKFIIWEKYCNELNLSYDRYMNYVKGISNVTIIKLSNVMRTYPSPNLCDLRYHLNDFRPPQYFKYLNYNDDLMKYLLNLTLTHT